MEGSDFLNKFLVYANGNSDNHGCEAITRSTVKILSLSKENSYIATSNLSNDMYYGVDKLSKLFEVNYLGEYSVLKRIINKISRQIQKKNICKPIMHYEKLKSVFSNVDIALSAGGDNYCYDDFEWLKAQNKIGKASRAKLVLWGCSIEETVLLNQDNIKDLEQFDLIIARETITYNNLINAGLHNKIKLYPDPAFQLDIKELALPIGFTPNNTIGINVSPMIIEYENTRGLAIQNYKNLIKYIIESTNFQIALIPHVVRKNGDDRIPLTEIYNNFKETGRVILIDDCNCIELKGFISRCRMFIGARTHATIAAYSTCVPTLVVGYSVKARGIAQDIFGRYENYVIPVQSLQNEYELIKAFQWLLKYENDIRSHLKSFMPSYNEKAWQAGNAVRELIGE